MADLSATQQSDIRADLAIDDANQDVFTDAQFNRLFVRAGEIYNETVGMALWQLLIDSAKFNDYTAGQTRERKAQIHSNLKDAYKTWRKDNVASATQLKIVGMTAVPPRVKDKPNGTR